MKNKLFNLILALMVAVGLAAPAIAQTSTYNTTLAAAVANATTQTVTVASSTNMSATSQTQTWLLWVDGEVMNIRNVNGTTITVTRAAESTRARAHPSGSIVYFGPSGGSSGGIGSPFTNVDPYPGSTCTATQFAFLPTINTANSTVWNCTNSEWISTTYWNTGTIKSSLNNDMDIQTQTNDETVRINSRNYDATSGDVIGFQSKPRLTTDGSQTVYGGQISANMSTGVDLTGSGSVIGLHVDTYMRGTTASTIAGDVRGLQIEMVTDDSGNKTYSGYVAGIRIRTAFSATAITGNFVPIRIEKPEAQTGSQTYDAALELTSTVPLVWNNAPATEPTTADGYIKVIVNSAARYIQLYSGAPVD